MAGPGIERADRMRRDLTWPALVLSMAVLCSAVLSTSAAAPEPIGSGITRTVTVAAQSHDAYQVDTPRGQTASIAFTASAASSSVDFYVMTAAGYGDYANPSSPSFSVVNSDENKKSFAYSTTATGLIFVLDNDDVTSSGAPGAQAVTYDIAISFQTIGGPSPLSIGLAAMAGLAVFGSIAVIVLTQRKRRRAAAAVAPPPFMPPPSYIGVPPPPPPDAPAAPAPPIEVTSGKTHRTLSPMERDILVRDFKSQRGKAAILPIFGLALSIVYTIFPSVVAIGLMIPAFLAPVLAHSFAKHRRALAAGNVTEFRGVPIALGAEQTGKQQLHRVQFGTESVSVSPSLLRRLVPNQPNSLAVLDGVNMVIALNGTPLSPPIERVRLAAYTMQANNLMGAQ